MYTIYIEYLIICFTYYTTLSKLAISINSPTSQYASHSHTLPLSQCISLPAPKLAKLFYKPLWKYLNLYRVLRHNTTEKNTTRHRACIFAYVNLSRAPRLHLPAWSTLCMHLTLDAYFAYKFYYYCTYLYWIARNAATILHNNSS